MDQLYYIIMKRIFNWIFNLFVKQFTAKEFFIDMIDYEMYISTGKKRYGNKLGWYDYLMSLGKSSRWYYDYKFKNIAQLKKVAQHFYTNFVIRLQANEKSIIKDEWAWWYLCYGLNTNDLEEFKGLGENERILSLNKLSFDILAKDTWLIKLKRWISE